MLWTRERTGWGDWWASGLRPLLRSSLFGPFVHARVSPRCRRMGGRFWGEGLVIHVIHSVDSVDLFENSSAIGAVLINLYYSTWG